MSIQLKVNVVNNIGPLLQKMQTKLDNLPKEAHAKFVAITPIDKGRARSSTKLNGKTIKADYPYAGKLDTGHSKQFGGVGMTTPTQTFINKRFLDIMAGK